jgi:tight adherence protein B
METWVLNSLAFFGAFLAVIAANAVLVDFAAADRRRLNQVVQERQRQRRRERIRSEDLEQAVRRVHNPRTNLHGRVLVLLEQSGLDWTLRRLAWMSAALAAATGLFIGVLTASAALTAPAAVLGAAMPLLHVIQARRRRLQKLLAQLPDTFELMSRVLRSGQTVAQAMQVVAEQGSPPVSIEFYHCYEQMNLGMTPEAVLRDLAQRTGLLEIKIFTVAVLVQRQTGGNLSELFDKMGTVVRERSRIRGMISSLTAQGRMQALILSSLPVAMFVLLTALNPGYELTLLQYPWMIVTALGLMVCGSWWIHRVVHFDF